MRSSRCALIFSCQAVNFLSSLSSGHSISGTGTMEAADVLYGVTMQERGVSKVLTINMNDMAKELNIKE